MTSRHFTAQTINGRFVIAERLQAGRDTVDRQTAWDRARAQAAPVLFIDTEGNERELGDCFSTAAFEQAMYSGHVGYELSMTDGHYAPEPLAVWVAEFRQFPRTSYNDAHEDVKAAIFRYCAEIRYCTAA